jgi:hypothetical protein
MEAVSQDTSIIKRWVIFITSHTSRHAPWPVVCEWIACDSKSKGSSVRETACLLERASLRSTSLLGEFKSRSQERFPKDTHLTAEKLSEISSVYSDLLL